MMRNAALAVACLLAALVAGCGDEAPIAGLPEPVRHTSARFVLQDFTGAPRALVDSMLERLELEYDRVDAFFPEFVNPDSIVANILPGNGIPFVTLATVELNQFRGDLAFDYFVHQLTHLWTRYAKRPFLEEGIAVYATEQLVPTGRLVNPYWRQPPHAWVALFVTKNSLIPLAVAWDARNFGFAYRGSSADASAWQVFVEAGSFTRWVIDTHGRDAWRQLYRTEDLEGTLGSPVAALEADWVAAARALEPAPLECAEALAPLDSRREFWCHRANGG